MHNTYISSNKWFHSSVVGVQNFTMFHKGIESIRQFFAGFSVYILKLNRSILQFVKVNTLQNMATNVHYEKDASMLPLARYHLGL